MLSLAWIFAGVLFVALTAWGWGAVACRHIPVPHVLRLALGAVIFSVIVFTTLLAGLGSLAVFAILGAAPYAILLIARPRIETLRDAAVQPLLPIERCLAIAIGATYGAWYLFNALAPETLPDGYTYHLGLVSEYVRTGSFPHRIAFYEMLPQGMEMLFTPAFAIGRHSAAKLVEFVFFAATLPLLVNISRRLAISDRATFAIAVVYFCAPLVAITGSSSYNDAGQVFFALAAFYLMLLWYRTADARYLLPAGALAGFCYAVKMPGAFVPAAGFVFLIVRSFVLTGNPFAPLLNQWFPNPWFHIATESALTRHLRSLGGVPYWRVPWELAVGGRFTGIYGPLLLALPLAALAWKRPAARLCCALSMMLALPWFANASARFVMAAIPFAALALGLALDRLPRAASWAAIALQAVVCFPLAMDAWEPSGGFRLREFPLAAALRAEAEPDYLARHLPEYKVARMLEENTPAGARILALPTVATAYTTREVSVPWQSATADSLLDTLKVAGMYQRYHFYDVSAEWSATTLDAVRVRLPQSAAGEWCIHEVELLIGRDEVPANRNWTLNSWPNPIEAPLARDHNQATRWRTWEPMRAGMHFELMLDAPRQLTGLTF